MHTLATEPNRTALMRLLIVDDEPLARDNLRIACASIENVDIIGECADGGSAVEAIERLQPDVVLLDVQMPGIDGFGVIDQVGVEHMPLVVFVTAWDAHALRAFRVHAFDYVLKPFDDRTLREVVERVREQLRDRRDGARARQLAAMMASWTNNDSEPQVTAPQSQAKPYITRITVRAGERIRYIACAEVESFQASGNYIVFHANGETHRVRMTINTLLAQLNPSVFVRIHRSSIVNIDCVREVQPWFGGDYIAYLKSGTKLRVSRSRAHVLLKPGL